MDFMLQNILNYTPTNKLIDLLSVSNCVSNICLNTLYNRRVHFCSSVSDTTVQYILTKYNFKKIDLENNKNITDNIVDYLKDKNSVFLAGSLLSDNAIRQLNNCCVLDISDMASISAKNTIQHLNNVAYLKVAFNHTVDSQCIKKLLTNNNRLHTIDLYGTEIDSSCLNNLLKIHQCDAEYTNIPDDTIASIGNAWSEF